MTPQEKECCVHPQRTSAMRQQDLHLGEIDGHVIDVNWISVGIARAGKNRRSGMEHDGNAIGFRGAVNNL